MDFNLAAKGRPSQIKTALKEQAQAIAETADAQTAKCAEVVAAGLTKWLEDQDPKDALSVTARVWGHAL